MKKYFFHIIFSVVIVLAVSFKTTRKYRGAQPTSIQPHAISNITGLAYNVNNNFYINEFVGMDESKIYLVEKTDLIDTINQDFLNKTLINKPPRYNHNNPYFGFVWYASNLQVDESEISNLAWQEFLFYIKRDSTESYYKKMTINPNILPTNDYFSNPFYRFYPVVGISFFQANEYCKWRTVIFNTYLQNEDFKVKVRLPSEKEWEHFASGGLDLKKYPYGVGNYYSELKLKKKSGAYFKTKNKLSDNVEKINTEIKKLSKNPILIINFNCNQELPFYLKNTTPNYVFNLPINLYGLYNVLGNVAEMTNQEGLSKGGSYIHDIKDCKISSQIRYDSPTKYLGFRPVCQIIKKKSM